MFSRIKAESKKITCVNVLGQQFLQHFEKKSEKTQKSQKYFLEFSDRGGAFLRGYH